MKRIAIVDKILAMGEFLKAQSFWSRLSGFLQLVRVTVSATAAVVVVMVAVWLGTPVKWLLQTELLLHPQNANAPLVSIGNIAAALLPYNGSLPTDIPSLNQPVQIQQGGKMFLIVSPTVPLNNTNTNGSSNSDNSQDAATTTMEQMLGDWYHQNLDWFQKSLQSHGGVLLRGFPLDNPQQFDRLVANIHRDAVGTGVYLGNSYSVIVFVATVM